MSAALNKIDIYRDGDLLQTVDLEDQLVVGRAEDCGVVLDDRAISREHVLLKMGTEGVEAIKRSDFASVRLNGEECTSALMKQGDVLALGPFEIKIRDEEKKVVVQPESGTKDNSKFLAEPAKELSGFQDLGNIETEKPLELQSNEVVTKAEEPAGHALSPVETSSFVAETSKTDTEVSPEAVPELSLSGSTKISRKELEEPALVDTSGSIPGLNLENHSSSSTDDFSKEPSDGSTKIISLDSRIKAHLEILTGTANVTELELQKDSTCLGRGQECDVVLADKKSSRKHCEIRKTGNTYLLVDLNSANGTYLNGSRISERALQSGDEIKIGGTAIHFKIVDKDYDENQSKLNFTQSGVTTATRYTIFQNSIGTGATAQISRNPLIGQSDFQFESIPVQSIQPEVSKFSEKWLNKLRDPKVRRQGLVAIVALLAISELVEMPEFTKPSKSESNPTVAGTSDANRSPAEVKKKSFNKLTKDQKEFIVRQHQLGLDLYRNKEYDRALVELRKIFAFVDDYETAREVERYAAEGKRLQEAQLEELKRKEEEEKIRVEVANLEKSIDELIESRNFEQAKELFAQVLALDPENAQISKWKIEIQNFEQEQKYQADRAEFQNQLKTEASRILASATSYQKKGAHYKAVVRFEKILQMPLQDKKIVSKARNRRIASLKAIDGMIAPYLSQAGTAESNGNVAEAFKNFRAALNLNPRSHEAQAGIDRVRGALHDRAKSIYTEAVLAESYSDYAVAKKNYEALIEMLPEDDLYFQRAKRKIQRYKIVPEGVGPS